MYEQPPLLLTFSETIYIMVDPAAGGEFPHIALESSWLCPTHRLFSLTGPQSDYAFVTFTRMKGLVQVFTPPCFYATR
jgi:hypothetical protein